MDTIDAQVRDALAGLNSLARDIAARHGKAVSDRMAAKGQRRRDMIEASHAISEASHAISEAMPQVGPSHEELQRLRYPDGLPSREERRDSRAVSNPWQTWQDYGQRAQLHS